MQRLAICLAPPLTGEWQVALAPTYLGTEQQLLRRLVASLTGHRYAFDFVRAGEGERQPTCGKGASR